MSHREIAPLAEGYRVVALADQDAVGADALLAFWEREGAMDADAAARRVHEVLFVGLGPGDELVAVGTAHLQRSSRLRTTFWYAATFVAGGHRHGNLAFRLLLAMRDHLAGAHARGEDRRAAGVMVEVQHRGLRGHLRNATWRSDFTFVGQNPAGDHVRVHYFAGVRAPEPPAVSGEETTAAEESREGARPAPEPDRRGPVFVVAAPGSGATALRDALARSPQLEVVPGDGLLLEAAPELHPSERGWSSGRLSATDNTPERAERLRAAFAAAAPEGRPLVHAGADALRVGFLHAAFPEATFVYLYRDPGEAVPAALAGWETGAAVIDPQPPGWNGPPWCFALTPEWRALREHSTAEIAAAQWEAATRIVVGELQRLPPSTWSVVDQGALADDPPRELDRLAAFLGVELGEAGAGPIAAADAVPQAPAEEIEAALTRTPDTAEAARAVFAEAPPVADRTAATAAAAERPAPPRSVASAGLADLLEELRASVLLSAPGADTVAIARRLGPSVNTHLRAFDRPTALARRGGRLAVGTRTGVAEYHDIPAARDRLAGPVGHDACFVALRSHHTGKIDVHDLAYANEDLWLVNTRFSCLCTLDGEHSFVPRWTPPFITELAGDDRCHLSGLCVAGDDVRYVTALGASDEPGGWRKGDAGIVIDVASGEIVATGLSEPHSPRWHRDHLWILESGKGGIGTVDPASGRYTQVAELPGFSRGLSFCGSLAFIGVSATAERHQCGVWVIDVESGETVALLRFEDGVEELSDVLVLPGVVFPEIAEPESDAAANAFAIP